MPAWLIEGLRYAPLAALAAVVAPEVVMTQGELIRTWQDPRLFACRGRHRVVLLAPRHARHHRGRHRGAAGAAPRASAGEPQRGELSNLRTAIARMNVLRFSDLFAQGQVTGKRVFIRADLNVPQDDAGRITEDTRIRASRALHPAWRWTPAPR